MTLNVEGPGALEIALAYSGTVVDGTVTDSAGMPITSSSVVFSPKGGLIPSPPIVQVRAGSFRAAGLPPGAYDVFAWDAPTSQSAQTREYLKQFESSAKSLTIEPGGRATLQLIAISTGAAGAGQARTAAKGSIEGQVLNALTGAPLAGARVIFSRQQLYQRNSTNGVPSIVTSNGQPPEGSVEADPQGRFSFREIEPGLIYFAAELRGFGMPTPPDQPTAAGERMIVGEGQRIGGAVIKMLPEVVIAGKVTDEYGEAVDRAEVTLYRALYLRGVRQLMRAGVAQTDDLGQYRIPGVAHGAYYVSVTRRAVVRSVGGQPAGAPVEPGMGYGTTWFPNAPGLAGASALLVDGAQPPYLTMVLRRAKVFRLRGTLLDAGGQPAARAVMSLMPRGLESNASAGEMTVADGAFEVSNVPAGSYVLLARSASLPGPMALLPVEVRDANVDGLKLQLSAGREIRGTVKSDAALASFLVGLYPQGLGSVWGRTNGGAFSIRGVLPAVYSVDASGLCPNCYVKSVRYGGKEVSEDAVDFSEDGQLEIEVSTRGASLQGTAVDRQGKPVPRAAIVLAPAAGTGAIRTGVTDQAGRFSFASLRPGAYRIFAWTGIMPDPSPEALARFQGQAKPVNLPESGRERVEVIAQ
jgi:protocatechuate 3,4-dioxygenase beta subunit